MKSKLFLCAALAAALYVTPSYAADYSAQVVSFSQEDPDNLSIELTGSKVITDDFSFKLPSQSFSRLIMVPNGDSYEVYEKTAYEANGGGLLFRILAFEDTHYRDLNGCTILGFCGNKIFLLDPHYDEQYASDSEEYTQCKEIVTSLKNSFISYIKDAGTVE